MVLDWAVGDVLVLGRLGRSTFQSTADGGRPCLCTTRWSLILLLGLAVSAPVDPSSRSRAVE